ncbi:sugar-binding transcriptional regulator [Microlunatus soli]|uniref:DNA-binding transcriptional regulator LsrR, DeoR family n=1 Tax=Microlunatus soli TaxID=630515 RepID=A0A1H1TUN8_9ACTN|nr:sugar-binding domain-containing protein [Microlunatus soli]SDS63864.1 DNA-binding transcriptional regulator LsrR, DeoR family [Microlunatus soli]
MDAAGGTDADPKLLAEVARRYYLDDESKVAIAGDLGFSRFQIARMLRTARDSGMVRIEVGGRPGTIDDELSAAVQDRLGVRRALVMSSTSRQPASTIIQQLGALLADLFGRIVEHGDVVGLGWSRVCDAMVEQLTELPRCTIVQLAGNLSRPGDTSGSVEAVRRAAAVAGGECYPIYSPMIIEDAGTAEALRRQPEIAEALDRARDLTVALVSVGAWGSPRSRVYESVAPELREAGKDAGVCGEISGRLFDHHGRPVTDLIDSRVISISLEKLAGVPEVVATAWGPDQATAMSVAAAAGWVHTAVVDETLARELLATVD